MRSERSRPRWWILLVIAAAAAVSIALAWQSEAPGQTKVLATMGIAAGAALALLLWAATPIGRLPRRARLPVVVAFAAAAGLLAVLVRIRGVSGDLVPILEWRFAASRDASLPPLEPSLSPAVAGARGTSLADWPQFLGPGRNGTVEGIRLARDWTASPPRLRWRREVGAGWSGFAVAGDAAFTQEQRGSRELVASYDLRTGSPRWAHGEEARYETVLGGVGPRATPTVDGDRVLALGATGLLTCLDRATGSLWWRRDVLADNGATLKEWGMSGSPLVDGDLVIVAAGGPDGRSLAAYRRETGEPAWSGGSDRAGYASPLLASFGGERQIVVLNGSSVAAHDPETGRLVWQEPWPGSNPSAAQPRAVGGDRLLVSSGYGVGCALFWPARGPGGEWRVETVWRGMSLKAKFANFVHRGDTAWGLDDGILAAIDLADGRRRWKAGRYGHGQLILVGDVLLVTAESGEVILVDAVAGEHRELGRFPAIEGKTWNSPALAPPLLLVRNDREAACWELPLEPGS